MAHTPISLNMASFIQEITCACGGTLSPKHSITCLHFRYRIEKTLCTFRESLQSHSATQLQSLWDRLVHVSEYEELSMAFWACMKLLYDFFQAEDGIRYLSWVKYCRARQIDWCSSKYWYNLWQSYEHSFLPSSLTVCLNTVDVLKRNKIIYLKISKIKLDVW